MSLREMVSGWRGWCKNDPRFRGRVPVAWGGAGDYVFHDLGPDADPKGAVVVLRGDSAGPDPVASSFRAWLEAFAADLEADAFAYSAADGCLMYADELDLD